jgi:beta-glucosidase/6-phospho-beta-glucosidase/beta-galactosidase
MAKHSKQAYPLVWPLVVIALRCSFDATATSLSPDDDVTSILGVNVHSYTPDLDLIQEAGLRWLRMDIAWEAIETTPHVYNFSSTDDFMRNLAARGLGLIAILGDCNPLYMKAPCGLHHGPHLVDGRSIAAFAAFGRAFATHYSKSNRPLLIELINEPNTGGGYLNASLYAEVALAAGTAIRSAGEQ